MDRAPLACRLRAAEHAGAERVLHHHHPEAQAGLPPEAARADIRNLLAWRPVAVDGDIIASAWAIEDRYRLNFWDALIVAAALAADCRYLLTEEMQDGADFDGLHVVNPLVAEVGSRGPLR